VQDPESYDRRSEEKKIKNDIKLKLRREFPVSISKVICAIISSMLSTTIADIQLYYYSSSYSYYSYYYSCSYYSYYSYSYYSNYYSYYYSYSYYSYSASSSYYY
jgi:hypothetical protein